MRILLWYCSRLAWTPTQKTIEDVADGVSREVQDSVVGFIHVEPEDEERASKVETKLVKNLKWLAGKWETKRIVLHSFSHLAEEKADAGFSQGLFERAHKRLEESGYEVIETPYGYFNDLELAAPGHPLARVFKQL
ncbi:MAG: threonyl-tRNA synthetase editing domain-containing protein [Deltaproteobacteria bacterium]|nr:threonyl-tRNA synthetase editing domain-containing protein [Deltaproteobacteria bacterium]